MYFWSFWGMNFFWWLFWIALMIVFFSLATPVSRSRVRQYDHPLSLLRRRYAAGEITTEEYDERRARLLKDLEQEETRSFFHRGQRPERGHT